MASRPCFVSSISSCYNGKVSFNIFETMFFDQVQDYLFYRDVASAFDPDIVLVGIYVANDAIEAAARIPGARFGKVEIRPIMEVG